jgi:RNA polymerase sigma-70 factor (ECF subfamily)
MLNIHRNFNERDLESLFRDHYTGLCRFAAGYVKDNEMAKEIVQEAFVSLWEKRDSIDPSKQVKSYLSTSVRNRCLNYLRDNRKFSGRLLELENHPHEPAVHPPDRLVEAEIRERIERAMETLPEKCREVFRLSRHRQMKYQQIADHLQISVKTVETQMSKALQHMRIHLAEYLPMTFFLISLFRYFAISLF